MVKFSHTLFALPFALSAVVLAARRQSVTTGAVLLVVIALGAARSAAMGFNRLVDASVDALNPRTRSREIPAGRLSRRAAACFTLLASAAFCAAALALGPLPCALSLPVLAILFSYSYAKRFTWLAHLILGFAIALAPLGAWIALTGGFAPEVLTLCLALMGHIAAFDILYALQDEEVDRRLGLHSIPVRFGPAAARRISRLLHLAAWLAFIATGIVFRLGIVYFSTAVLIGVLMLVEHRLVRGPGLKHLDIAFFHLNAAISLLLLAGLAGDTLTR
jgi:4-hydroxybenzoate polyprenyltransferase